MNKKITLILAIVLFLSLFAFQDARSAHYAGALSGYILLQVQENGEAWYVYPADGQKYFLGRPHQAFAVMRKLSLGARHDFIVDREIFPERLSGMILLDVEKNGEAYYIYPKNLHKYYLGRPADAFSIMRSLGLGAVNADLVNIPDGDIDKTQADLKPITATVLQDIPFTSQAPFGDWKDQRQQDGCEEATAIMAMKWVKGEKLSAEEALREITGISDFLQKKYGEYRDISPADAIKWIYGSYFSYNKIALLQDVMINDITRELEKGRLVIAPMNGQIMHNPYFTPPGPPRHMIVIKGYDPASEEFITNDPGTKHGESYRYDAKVLFDAIRDYPTGYHETIYNIEKDVLVIWK